MNRPCRLIFILAFVAVFSPLKSDAIDIVFDFTYDTNNFFGSAGSAQRVALDEAASFFETNFGDDLDAITPGGGNTWSAVFFDPTDFTSDISTVNLTVAADTIYIYVGSEDRGIANLGLAAPGGYGISALDQSFVDAITTRGETGMLTDDDFGTWGGTVSFNDNASIDWSFDTVNGPGATQYDFYSTAVHEIAHVFGFGIADSFTSRIVGDEFVGAYAVAENAGNVLLTVDGHIDDAVFSTVYGGGASQITIMADSAAEGEQLFMTELDVAMLQDTGWEVVPEPGSAMLLVGGSVMLLFRRRRRRESEMS